MARTKFLEIVLSPSHEKKPLEHLGKVHALWWRPTNHGFLDQDAWLGTPTARRENGGLNGNVIEINGWLSSKHQQAMIDDWTHWRRILFLTWVNFGKGIFCLEPSPEIAKDWIVQFFAVPVRLARTLASSVCLNIGLRVLDTGSKQRGFGSVFSVRPRRNWKKPICAGPFEFEIQLNWLKDAGRIYMNLQERSVFRERSGDNLDLDTDLT